MRADKMIDLTNSDELRNACSEIEEGVASGHYNPQWRMKLHDFLAEVCEADLDKRASYEFQRRIWTDNPISSRGQGEISVDKAIEDTEFRNWIAALSMKTLPDLSNEREFELNKFFEQLIEKISRYTSRTPRLKIYQVMAVFFPVDFSCVASEHCAKEIHKALFSSCP